MPILAGRRVADFSRRSRKCNKKVYEEKVKDFFGQIDLAINSPQNDIKSASSGTWKISRIRADAEIGAELVSFSSRKG